MKKAVSPKRRILGRRERADYVFLNSALSVQGIYAPYGKFLCFSALKILACELSNLFSENAMRRDSYAVAPLLPGRRICTLNNKKIPHVESKAEGGISGLRASKNHVGAAKDTLNAFDAAIGLIMPSLTVYTPIH